MSNFAEYGQTGRLYTATDSDTTKKASFNYAGTYITVYDVVVIRPSAVELAILGDATIEGVANIKTTSTVKKSMVLYLETDQKAYKIVNQPRYNRLFRRWRVALRLIDGVTVS